MKNLSVFSAVLLSWALSLTVQGQEIDDMYFNSRDRAKLNERKITADLGLTKRNNDVAEAPARINPTDSYSARNINPEYAAQMNASSSNVEEPYFLPDFQPTGVNQNLANCNCNSNSFYNPYFGNNAFNNPYYGSMGGFGSPFGGYYPNAWGYPSYGYGGFRPGLSMSMGYGWGGFNPGFYNGLGFGYGNFWNPYNNFNSWGGGFWGGYPTRVVVINNGDSYGRQTVQSKRGSRSTNVNQVANYTRPRNTNSSVTTPTRSNVSGGRTATAPEYYDRGWKRNQDTNTNRSYWNNSNSNRSNSSRSDFNWGGNSGGRQNSSGFNTSPSPSRGSFNNSGGTRSGSTGSSSSGTRGRNN